MGIIKYIKKLFAPNLDVKINNISRRVEELRRYVPKKFKKKKILSDEAFNIGTQSIPKEIQTFEPRPFEIIISMRLLKEKRIELENKRIADLRGQVLLNQSTIKKMIENGDAKSASDLLVGSYSTIKELNDAELLETHYLLLNDVKKLREQLRQKELERIRIQREKEEQEHRKKEIAEREQRARLEQERLQKKRTAREYEERLRSELQKREFERKRLIETITCKKPDSDKILDYLKRKAIKCFYHFTDEQNLTSIRQHKGLFSWFYCENNSIVIPNAGGNSKSRIFDSLHGLQDYVRLSFCSDHPMQHRLKSSGAKLVLLKIKVDVAAFKDTRFSNMNAAANAVKHGSSFEDLERVNMYAIKQKYVSKTDEIFHEHQAECMVKTFVPIEYIINIDHPQRI